LPEDAVLTAGGGYFSEQNVKTCEQRGLDPYITTAASSTTNQHRPRRAVDPQGRDGQAADGA